MITELFMGLTPELMSVRNNRTLFCKDALEGRTHMNVLK